MSVLKKELCNCCSQSIKIGQPICECSLCNKIIHGSCFNASKFLFTQNTFICAPCNENSVEKYNPFSVFNSGDGSKFYDVEPADVIESVRKISTILDKCSLCSVSDVNKLFSSDMSSMQEFSSFFLNVDGNKSNFDSFVSELELYKNKFSVIGLAETNTDPSLKSLYEISDYNSYYQSVSKGKGKDKDKRKSKGTGVAMYVHKSFNCEVNEGLSHFSPNLECIFVDITNTTQPITIGTIYRPHSGDIQEFIWELTALLENAPLHKTYIMGDFNMNLFNMEDPFISEYEEAILTNGFSPLISTYTHQQPNCKKTCIDNILTNCFDNIHSTGSIVDNISHHLPVFQISYLDAGSTNSYKPEKYVQYYDFSNSNVDTFVNELSTHTFSWSNNPDEDFTTFISTFSTVLDNSCKLVKPKVTKRNNVQNPWISTSIINSINKKHELCREWSKTVNKKYPDGDQKLYKKFSDYRRKLKKIIKWAKSNFYCKRFENTAGDMSKTWEVINSIRGKNKRSIKPQFVIDNERIIDRRIIANKFNEYFASLAVNMNNEVTLSNGIPVSELPSFDTFLGKSCSDSIHLDDCTIPEIETIISDLEHGKASDIPTKVIKQSCKVISPILQHLYNNCMANGVFPDDLKIGNISPIYKKGNEEHLENYRPVSTLPIFGKIFEKLIYTRLYKFLVSKNIIYDGQFGFRKGHSTSHALNYSVEEINRHLHLGKHVVGIFIDLSKAFDTINHEKLLFKLDRYGIRGTPLLLMSNYLRGRAQYTSVLGEKSEKLSVIYGVPQGSVLGPLLFLLYINDLINSSGLGTFVLYADDTNIFISGLTKRDTYAKANNVLKAIHSYMTTNQLHINLSKCNYMYFEPRYNVVDGDMCERARPFISRNSEQRQIYVNGKVIRQVSEIKFLGVILDENLSWIPHIEYLTKKLKLSIGELSRIRHVIPDKLYTSLYHTLFESHLTYAVTVWGGIPHNKLQKLFILQKKCIRILFGDSVAYNDKFCTCARARPFGKQKLTQEFFRKEESKPLFNNMKLLTVHNLYTYFTVLETYKILKLRNPISMFELYDLSKRKPTLIIVPWPTNCFVYKSVNIWNQIRTLLFAKENDFSMKISTLKASVKKYLLKKQTNYDKNSWCYKNYSLDEH